MRERQNTVGGAREMRVGRAGRTQAAHAVAEGESESQEQPLKIRDAPSLEFHDFSSSLAPVESDVHRRAPRNPAENPS